MVDIAVRSLLRFPVVVLLMTVARAASAQVAPRFALDRFEPAERGSDWFAGESLDLRGHLRPAVGVVGDYAYRPLAIYNRDGSVRAAMVRHALFAHAGGSLVLADRVRLSLSLPIQAFTEGQDGAIGSTTYPAPPAAQGVGDLRLGADLRVFGKYGGPVTGAFGLQVALPTGDRAQYSSDGDVRLRPRAMVAGAVGLFVYAAQVNLMYRAPSDAATQVAVGSELGLSGAAGVRLLRGRLVVGPEIFGATTFDEPLRTRSTPLEGIAGAHYLLPGDVRIGAGVGAGLTRGWGSPVLRALLSVEWAPGPKAERRRPKPEETRPPAPPPAPSWPWYDSDHDGLRDLDDACPTVAGPQSDDPMFTGCPERDRDKDGILNADDACPDERGPKDLDPSRHGCPKAFVRNGQIKILDQVKFRTASAQLLPGKDSDDVLGAVLAVLTNHPEIAKVRVEGHTDDRGGAAANLTLSAKRAEAVVTWLVAHGIARERLESRGLGASTPLESNETEGGRSTNRRVEFHIEP